MGHPKHDATTEKPMFITPEMEAAARAAGTSADDGRLPNHISRPTPPEALGIREGETFAQAFARQQRARSSLPVEPRGDASDDQDRDV